MALMSAVVLSGCSLQKEYLEPVSSALGVGDTYGWFYYGGDVQNGLPQADARPQSFANCGQEQGQIKLFNTAAGDQMTPVGWWDDRVWRRYARPAGSGACEAGETRDEAAKTCWRSYGVQFFPSSPIANGNRLQVVGTSPIMRVLPKDGYPVPNQWCRFDGDAALIWVAGVSNRGLGLAWSLVDNQLLASIVAWNRNSDGPAAVDDADVAGHGKLKTAPAYIQIVQNDNAPAGGIAGDHSVVAINTMAANLELAYRSGLKHVEVVTHSNGVVSSQLGFAMFTQVLAKSRWNEDDWLGTAWNNELLPALQARRDTWLRDRRATGAPDLMTVNFYHLQAAASERWANGKLDAFGFYSDMLPTARWVWKTGLGLSYWGWDWLSPSYYNDIASFVQPEFRFYYNAPDWMTYDYYRYSSVGRRESMPWQAETHDHLQVGAKPKVVHYICTNAAPGVCGPGHDQADSMWYFSSPAMPDTGLPAPWEVN